MSSIRFQPPITSSQLTEISSVINQLIQGSQPVLTTTVPYADVKDVKTVIKLANHQYPSDVRLVSVGELDGIVGEATNAPVELCGGT